MSVIILDNILGGSNEPFLNKPARFTHLSEDNAVRKGRDQETLLLLIKIFNSIKTSQDAKEYLSCVFSILKTQLQEKAQDFDGVVNYSPTLVEIYEFSLRFISKSYEGETSVIIVSTLESLLHNCMNGNYEIIAHKVNQSGASSKEVGDIDVYRDSTFYYSIEVKDKDFTEYDVEHAFNKVFQNKGKKAAFVYGLQANFNSYSVEEKIAEYTNEGRFVILQDISSHIKNILFRLPSCTKQDFTQHLINVSKSINCKKETKQWMLKLFKELDWESIKNG